MEKICAWIWKEKHKKDLLEKTSRQKDTLNNFLKTDIYYLRHTRQKTFIYSNVSWTTIIRIQAFNKHKYMFIIFLTIPKLCRILYDCILISKIAVKFSMALDLNHILFHT